MTSIRVFLIAGIVATLVLYNFIAALRGYQTSMQEAETLFDNQLLDMSQLVANLDLESIAQDFRLGNNLAFQVWEQDRLLSSSFYAPLTSMNAFVPGFDYANFDGYRWRTFTRLDAESDRWIIVAERADLRFILAENVVLESIAPILLGIPLAGLLIWIIVSLGLKPLQQLSAELRENRGQDLSLLRQRKTPRELDQVVQSINGFIHRLSAALDREKRFSADAAHELRTPISALKIQLHNLAQEVDVNSESFVQLQQGVERIQHLVEQLLWLYRSSPEQFVASWTRLNLLTFTQEAVARLYPLIEERQQTLELEGDVCFINGDRFALETLVVNLLSNASKYTQAGGYILLKLERRPQEVCLIVADNGPGIPIEERPYIFEPFYLTGNVDHAGVTGCGLGLPIVQQVAEIHGAKVLVEDSGLGSGVAFRICFPELESNDA